MSLCNNMLLLNTSYKIPELHLYNLDTMEIVNQFDGYYQEKFMIKCQIGGPKNSYIACGSEDGRIHIWHKLEDKNGKIIKAHNLTINYISFNPKYPSVMASASDDENIKIWVPEELAKSCAK